jgi:2-(1,2-epoxy-1,2-dihydrophenyl)acetyl-CoA isomerase
VDAAGDERAGAPIERRREGAVLQITLNRPDRLNALTRPLLAALGDALSEAEAPQVRAVVLTGAGRAFCVGQDLGELVGAGPREVGRLLREHYAPLIMRLQALEKPVLAAINGPAAGAGMSLALACDVRVAAESAAFVPAFLGVGLVPDAGASHALARLLGGPRALEWMVSGRRLDAGQARSWGLVSEVIADDAFPEVAAERARELAAMPTRAVALAKRLFRAAALGDLQDQLELEAELQEEAAGTADFAEGARAFLEKRDPRFTGS